MKKIAALSLCLSLTPILGGQAQAANTLDVNGAAALEGNFGLQVSFDNSTNKVYVIDNSPNEETTYRARFLFKKNTWSLNDTQKRNTVFLGRQDNGDGTKKTVMRIMMIRTINFGYIMRAAVRKDDDFWKNCGDWTLPTATGPASVREIVLEWQAASSPGANDGYCRQTVNDNVKAEVTNIDNDTVAIDQVWLGLTEGNIAAASGVGYIDSFESYRSLIP